MIERLHQDGLPLGVLVGDCDIVALQVRNMIEGIPDLEVPYIIGTSVIMSSRIGILGEDNGRP
jgi:hypothetical protein